MTKQLLSALAIAAVLTFVGQTADAQSFSTHGSMPGVVSTVGHYGPGGTYLGPKPIGHRAPAPYWGSRPSYPHFVTPSQVTGINPWTGGLDTGNLQVNNTYYDYGRNSSQYNGTRRWVNRPVYDGYGNVTGYQEGYVWNNSFTGQEHAHLNTRTPNGLGGENNTTVMRSTIAPQGGKK